MQKLWNFLKSLIRIGTVSSINYEAGRIRVAFPDQDNMVSDEIPYLNFEYQMPSVGDLVLCVFLGNGVTRGFCLGAFWNVNNQPLFSGKGIWYKEFAQNPNSWMKYDDSTQTLTFNVTNFVFNGNMTINGNLQVDGTIQATGDIIGNGISLDNHVHGGVSSGGALTLKPQ